MNFVEKKKFTYLKALWEGGFASVIAVLIPKEEVFAVKIVEAKDVNMIEDQIWPLLSHRDILPVLDALDIDKPDDKLYLTLMLPKALDETIHNDQFRCDPNGLTKLKHWMNDILLAVECLHSCGFCHYHLKADNVLIDIEDRAFLCAFSGLNYIRKPLNNIISSLIFQPPECIKSVPSQNVQRDIWHIHFRMTYIVYITCLYIWQVSYLLFNSFDLLKKL